jgi:hypothetical protein
MIGTRPAGQPWTRGEDDQLRAMLEAGTVMLLLLESNGQLTKPFPQAEKFRDAA